MRLSRAGLAAATALLLGGWNDVVHDERLDGTYRLIAIDTREAMIVCRRISGAFCVGDELPGPTVFAAGANSKYVVIARHPADPPAPPNKSVSHYYYVVRRAETDFLRDGDVVGPLSRRQFEAERRRLGLPPFSRVFGDLQ
jgi:hypothetical protein